MNENEVPEKIYLFENPISGAPDNRWLSKRSGDEDIEYTRTDAFIEKACDYLNSQLYDWVSITNPDQRSCANVIPKENFIEDFKKYMKGAVIKAELERIEHETNYEPFTDEVLGKRFVCGNLLSFIDTLEVKDFELTWEDVAWIVNKGFQKCKVESTLTAEDICKDVLNQFKAYKGE